MSISVIALDTFMETKWISLVSKICTTTRMTTRTAKTTTSTTESNHKNNIPLLYCLYQLHMWGARTFPVKRTLTVIEVQCTRSIINGRVGLHSFYSFSSHIYIGKNWLKSGSTYSLHKVKICFWLLLNMWWWVRLFELTGPCFFCSMNRAWDYEEEKSYFCSTIYKSIIFNENFSFLSIYHTWFGK